MFSSRRGFSCDSVTEFKVVLASGELVRANASENADLWASLKGGLNNFGIVTAITMRTIAAGDIWGGVTYYLPGTFSELARAAFDFAHDETDDNAHIMFSAGYGYGHQAMTCLMYHTQGKVNPPVLQRFTAVQPQIEQMCTMRTSTHLGFCDELSRFSNNGGRWVAQPPWRQGHEREPTLTAFLTPTDNTGLPSPSNPTSPSWKQSMTSGRRR